MRYEFWTRSKAKWKNQPQWRIFISHHELRVTSLKVALKGQILHSNAELKELNCAT